VTDGFSQGTLNRPFVWMSRRKRPIEERIGQFVQLPDRPRGAKTRRTAKKASTWRLIPGKRDNVRRKDFYGIDRSDRSGGHKNGGRGRPAN
jgi:hypothetical protein